ncbi:Spherulation-specific family 4-domain-containing protein [Aspergillus coremiiformis]|uniref:Spherulation-specific family 4-domain-containing protein n=1 Tax=Aspergillus coremiiformis TaxID=138285 RepID=A0A5N6ZCV0_9EURO|nr:Spherulation-specific family 4-domain-containing protein [Aspergillus coremiiformis]
MLSKNLLRALGGLFLLSQVAQAAAIPIRRDTGEDQSDDDAPEVSSSRTVIQPTGVVSLPSSSATPTVSPQPGKGAVAGSTEIIIPYYVYPEGGSWGPLEQLIDTNPNMKFTVIVNPSSGPGSETLPDDNWRKAVPKLTTRPNVKVIGYVATTYGGRPLSAVEKDISIYGNWPSASGDANFKVNGIFFDEGSAESDHTKVQYYKDITSLAKQNQGLGPNNHVVINPGTVPDKAYLEIPDSTVIFESPHSKFQEAIAGHNFDAIKNVDKAKLSSIVTAVPGGVNLGDLVTQLRDISGQIYLSSTNDYMKYSSALDDVAHILKAN